MMTVSISLMSMLMQWWWWSLVDFSYGETAYRVSWVIWEIFLIFQRIVDPWLSYLSFLGVIDRCYQEFVVVVIKIGAEKLCLSLIGESAQLRRVKRENLFCVDNNYDDNDSFSYCTSMGW